MEKKGLPYICSYLRKEIDFEKDLIEYMKLKQKGYDRPDWWDNKIIDEDVDASCKEVLESYVAEGYDEKSTRVRAEINQIKGYAKLTKFEKIFSKKWKQNPEKYLNENYRNNRSEPRKRAIKG